MAKPKLKTKPEYGPPAPKDTQPKMAPPVPPALSNVGSIGKPMLPSTPLAAAPPAPAPIGQPIFGKMAVTGGPPPVMPTDVQPPTLSPNPTPPVSSIGTPIQPTAPRPANARLSQLQEQGPPQYHGLKRVLDTMAGATTIGTAIERGGGLGTQGYEANVERAGGQAKLEDEQQKSIDTSQKTQAETEAEKATAHHSDVTSDVAQQNAESVMVTLPDGRSITVPAKDKAGVIKAMEGIKSREGIAQDQISARQALQDGKPISIDELASQAIQDNDQQTLQKVQAYKTAIAKAGASQPGSYMPVNDAAGNTVGWVNPKAEGNKQYIPVGAIPGVGAAAGGQGQSGAPAIPPKPTAATLTMADMARTVQQVQPEVLNQLAKVEQEVGPGVGRWNQLWVNGAGLNDPEFAKLDTMLDLYASAVVRTHFGARGGMQYREELRKQFGEAQSPADLRARIAGADVFISQYAKPGGNSGSSAPAAADKPPAAQPGMKVQSRVVNGKTEYRQVPIAAN